PLAPAAPPAANRSAGGRPTGPKPPTPAPRRPCKRPPPPRRWNALMNETVRHASDSPDSADSADPPAITQTRLTHATHRLATDLLVDAVDRPSADPGRLAELRDFVVTHLRHHHETEDALLWPRIVAAAPETEHLLHRLSQEHDRLDDALDRLAAVDLTTGDQAAAGADTEPAGHGVGPVRAGLRD